MKIAEMVTKGEEGERGRDMTWGRGWRGRNFTTESTSDLCLDNVRLSDLNVRNKCNERNCSFYPDNLYSVFYPPYFKPTCNPGPY